MRQTLTLNKMLSELDKKSVVNAIQTAEEITSGEIRVHIDKKGGKEPFKEAKRVFERLGMTKTKERNGVLIYLCFTRKQIAILGDQGINEKVPEGYWDELYHSMATAFRNEQYGQGICEAIERIGEKLSAHFPVNADNPNELSNEITEA
jgi:uncharacterized membrane protein